MKKKQITTVVGIVSFILSILIFVVWCMTDFTAEEHQKEVAIWFTSGGMFIASLIVITTSDSSGSSYDGY